MKEGHERKRDEERESKQATGKERKRQRARVRKRRSICCRVSRKYAWIAVGFSLLNLGV